MHKIILGLGNTGYEYKKFRHNAGSWLVEAIKQKYKLKYRYIKKLNINMTSININNITYYLLFIKNYINLSGYFLHKVLQYYNISTENVFIAHDDIYLPCGQIKTEYYKKHRGHNGIKNIIKYINKNFCCIRIGIGSPDNIDELKNYVLTKPTDKEFLLINNAIDKYINNFIKNIYQYKINK